MLKESEKFGATSEIGDNEKEVKYGKPEEEEGEPKPKESKKGETKEEVKCRIGLKQSVLVSWEKLKFEVLTS